MRFIAKTAGVRYTRAAPIQINAVRSITRVSNQRQCMRTTAAGYTVNGENLTLVGLTERTPYAHSKRVVH